MTKYYADVTVKNALCLLVAFIAGDKDDFGEAQRLMGKMKPADVVEVVRCKDCKHSYDSVGGWCCSHGVCVDCVVPEDFYCAYGEHKENEG